MGDEDFNKLIHAHAISNASTNKHICDMEGHTIPVVGKCYLKHGF